MEPGAAFAGGGSMRYRNFGLVRIAIRAFSIAFSKSPVALPSLKKASGAARSLSVTGLRKARRATLETMRVAHGSSSLAVGGWQTKMRARFGESRSAPLGS